MRAIFDDFGIGCYVVALLHIAVMVAALVYAPMFMFAGVVIGAVPVIILHICNLRFDAGAVSKIDKKITVFAFAVATLFVLVVILVGGTRSLAMIPGLIIAPMLYLAWNLYMVLCRPGE